jgi:hypothetical protein
LDDTCYVFATAELSICVVVDEDLLICTISYFLHELGFAGGSGGERRVPTTLFEYCIEMGHCFDRLGTTVAQNCHLT